MNFRPVHVGEAELSEPARAIAAGPRYGSARLLARWYSEPLAVADIPLDNGTASAAEVAAALWREAGPAVARRLAAAGSDVPDAAAALTALTRTGLRAPGHSTYLHGRVASSGKAPPASVVICTRDRAERLGGCLDAVLGQEYPDFEVIVVDNAPAGDAVAELVQRHREAGTGGVALRHVVEQRPGLSWARNTGLAVASGRIIAYLDDDEHPDRHWLAELARGFTAAPGVAGVSGLVLPAVLDTPAQCLYERFGGHSKGRGMTAVVFDRASHARQHPLYPLPAFGVGASIAFDRAALERAGGFDVSLGAGTPARAGEDTAMIADLMLGGATFVYWPGAVMWHEHRRTLEEMARQLDGYGSGLTAFYTRALLRAPLPALAAGARLAPRAVRDLLSHDSVRNATMGAGYPALLRRASRHGMLAGPARYLRGRQRAARIRGRFS